MAYEFDCPNCLRPVTSSEAFIGRAVHCPHCQAVFEVPRFSARRAGRATSADQREFEFECPKCNQTVTARAELVGRPVACPRCEAQIHVPMPREQWARRGVPLSGLGGGGAADTGSEFFTFACHACSRLVTAQRRHAGMVSRCPFCQAELVIPTPAPGQPPAVPGGRRGAMLLVGSAEVVEATDGAQQLKCPRCGGINKIDAELCRRCGLAFTSEGIATRFANRTSGLAVTCMVIGIVLAMLSLLAWGSGGQAIPLNLVLSAIALAGLVMGVVALVQCAGRTSLIRGRGMAIAGLVLIGLSTFIVVGTGVYGLLGWAALTWGG